MNDRMSEGRDTRSAGQRDERAAKRGLKNEGAWDTGHKLPARNAHRASEAPGPPSNPKSAVVYNSVDLLLRQNGDCSVLKPARELELALQVVSGRQNYLRGILSVEPIARACIALVEEALERNDPFSQSSIFRIATIETDSDIAPIFQAARTNVRTARTILARCKGRWHEKRADEGESRESGTVSEEVQLDLCKIGVLLAEIPMRPRFTERFFEELRALAAKAGVPGVVPDKAGVQGYDGDTGDLWDLTKSQIAATFTDVNKAAESYLAAREELVRRNLLLVTSVANKFRVPGVSFSDLVQEGTMGLMNAIDRYRPELGFRFSTYATQWIKQSVRRHIEWNGKGVRVPGYVQRALGVVEKFKDEHRERTGRTPTPDETAAALAGKTGDVKVDEAWLRLSAPAARMQVSIDQPRSNDKNASPMSCFLPDRGTSPQSEVLDRLELEGLREILNQGLASLTYREREVIELRFGLGGGESHTLEEVGEKLGVTRERVRQVQKNAIKKLQLRVGKRRDTGDEG